MKLFLSAVTVFALLGASVLTALPASAGGGSSVRNGKKADDASPSDAATTTATATPALAEPTATPVPAPKAP